MTAKGVLCLFLSSLVVAFRVIKDAVKHLSGFSLHRRCHVPIESKRDGNVGVTQHLAHHLWVDALRKKQRCHLVPQVMMTCAPQRYLVNAEDSRVNALTPQVTPTRATSYVQKRSLEGVELA